MLVDLPGYGYAKASKTLAMEWQTSDLFLSQRPRQPAPRGAA